MRTSDAGIRFLMAHEGFRNACYNDPAGYATIGVGHLIGKFPCSDPRARAAFPRALTDQEVMDLLRSDLPRYEEPINRLVKVPLNQNQFDALVAFTFNVGVGGFSSSTVLRRVNERRFDLVREALLMWTKAGGKTMRGLVNRRNAEADLFERPVAPPPPPPPPVRDPWEDLFVPVLVEGG